MVYIRNGAVVEKQSPWTLEALTSLFWSIVAFITFFFRALFDPSAQPPRSSSSGPPSRRNTGPGGSGGAGGGGGGGARGARIIGLNDMPGANHTPRCGGGK